MKEREELTEGSWQMLVYIYNRLQVFDERGCGLFEVRYPASLILRPTLSWSYGAGAGMLRGVDTLSLFSQLSGQIVGSFCIECALLVLL